MFQVMYKYEGMWPEKEPLQVDGQFMGKAFSATLQVSPVDAKRKANNYLASDISTGIYADEPMLIWSEKPRWRLSLSLRLPMLETTELPGVIEIDAVTGKIIDISTNKLNFILEMADDIAQRLTLEAAPARTVSLRKSTPTTRSPLPTAPLSSKVMKLYIHSWTHPPINRLKIS